MVHLQTKHAASSPTVDTVPTIHELEVIIGQPRQTLFCPHPYYLFLVKEVASTRTLARHFLKKHPDHDLAIKYKCDQCGIVVDANDRSTHIRGHLDYANRPNDSTLDYGNIGLLAEDDPIDLDPTQSLKDMGLRLAPNPPYRIPSTVVGSNSPSTISSTPTTQSTMENDIVMTPTSPTYSSPDDLPRSLSCKLVSPTSSFNSSSEVPSDVRSDVVHSPAHEKEVSPPPPDTVTPPSDFSDSYPSARIDPDPTNIIHHSDDNNNNIIFIQVKLVSANINCWYQPRTCQCL